MQQAIMAERRSADPTASPSGNAFVINLVSSTTPVALIRPDHAGLNRFTFFVSRRREDGRERFRLHMGYFDTQEEAEKLLDIVRGIYPGAWAGLAPGRRLAAAAKGEARAAPAATAAAASAAAPVATATPVTPTAAAPRAVLPAALPATALQAAAAPVAAVTSAAPEPSVKSESNPRPAAVQSRDPEHQAAARSLSNIREAIASLGDSTTIPVLQAATQPTQSAAVELSDTAALRLLEGGAPAPKAAGRQPANSKPAGSQSGDSPAAGEHPREERPCYAVQLMWSVQAIAMAQVPQLAIFSAYTLYGAEGNRDGRRWYGLRLGFFTDAVSAKQVAHYVRADFSTVSVVPVTMREREQARLAAARASSPGKPALSAAGAAGAAGATGAGKPSGGSERAGGAAGAGTLPKASEFALIDDKESLTIKTAKPQGVVQLRGGVPVRATRGAPGKRAKQRPSGQIQARTRARPMTLEETLEILGAGQLQVDEKPGLSVNDSGVRHQRLEAVKGKPSKLTRLFERLSDRLGS